MKLILLVTIPLAIVFAEDSLQNDSHEEVEEIDEAFESLIKAIWNKVVNFQQSIVVCAFRAKRNYKQCGDEDLAKCAHDAAVFYASCVKFSNS